MIKGEVVATVEIPLRIVKVSKHFRTVTVEFPDGDRIKLRPGETLNVIGKLDFHNHD